MKAIHLFVGILFLVLITVMAWMSRTKAVQWAHSEEARIERLKQQGALPGTASSGPGKLSAMSDIFNPAPIPDARAEATVRAGKLSRDLIQTLGGRLKKALAEGGTVEALEVCSNEAMALTAGLDLKAGEVVRRTSLSTRNSANQPDAFERRWLESVADSTAEDPALIYSEIVPDPEGRQIYRQLTPIYLQGMCVVCHGTPEQIAPDVRAAIDRLYPNDRATGYQAGQLRGAVSVSIPLQVAEPDVDR